MAKLLALTLALVFTFMLVGLFSSSIYEASNDQNKTAFISYSEAKPYQAGNNTYANSGKVTSNLQLAAESMSQQIDVAIADFQSDDIGTKLAGAFGIISTITINTAKILILIVTDGFNFITGINKNLTELPAPWKYIAIIGNLAIALIAIYGIFKLVSYVSGREL